MCALWPSPHQLPHTGMDSWVVAIGSPSGPAGGVVDAASRVIALKSCPAWITSADSPAMRAESTSKWYWSPSFTRWREMLAVKESRSYFWFLWSEGDVTSLPAEANAADDA